jgi:hypothetical protein
MKFVKVEEIEKGDVIIVPSMSEFRRVTVIRPPSKKIVNGKTVYSSVACEYEYDLIKCSRTWSSGTVHTWNQKKEVIEGTGQFKKNVRVNFNSRNGILIKRNGEWIKD